MSLEGEILPDRPEAREKFLSAFRVAKAAHATLAFWRWLVAVLCTVVQAGGRFDEHVLHVRKFRDLRFCRRIAGTAGRSNHAGIRQRSTRRNCTGSTIPVTRTRAPFSSIAIPDAAG